MISMKRLNTTSYSISRFKRSLSVESTLTELQVKCPCGKLALTAKGSSWLNYICHHSSTREITKDAVTHMTSFKTNQVIWASGANLIKVSGNDKSMNHVICSCDKRELLANDYSDTLGVVSINVQHSPERCIHLPNHHFFYDQRVSDAHDFFPKWKTIIGSESMNDPSSSVSPGETTKVINNSLFHPVELLEPKQYHFTETEVPANHTTKISESKIDERRQKKYHSPTNAYIAPSKQKYDAIIVGGGHNGLVTAAYLSKAGMKPLVLERRHTIGGAAVTEEMFPGFHFSRASYLAGLLRPQIITDLELAKYGFKYLPRNPSSFTPTKLDSIHGGKYLLFQDDEKANYESIAQFSRRDAENFPKYEQFLNQIRDIMQPLLDGPPPDLLDGGGKWKEKWATMKQMKQLITVGIANRQVIVPFYELFTAPAQQILDRWFESDILKTTLATDAVIGALIGPKQNGSAYVLLHHVMGEAAGKKGVWAYVQGGMGSISRCLGEAAKEHGTEIALNAVVKRILVEKDRVIGVEMEDGSHLYADKVISGTTPYHTFVELMPEWTKQQESITSPVAKFTEHIRHTDYSCGAFKINCAVNELPNFTCYPSPSDGSPGPMHRGTIHFESQMEEIELAYREALLGQPATRPVIEMTIPTSIDQTIAPPGKHIVQLFIQYAPYDVHPKVGSWADPAFKEAFVQRCIKIVDEYCPNFSSSIIGIDAISPLDLEKIFGLHKGSISHGALGLHQLGYARPVPGYARHRTPLSGLYLCSAGTHPGGGVMGASGYNCSQVVLSDCNTF